MELAFTSTASSFLAFAEYQGVDAIIERMKNFIGDKVDDNIEIKMKPVDIAYSS